MLSIAQEAAQPAHVPAQPEAGLMKIEPEALAEKAGIAVNQSFGESAIASSLQQDLSPASLAKEVSELDELNLALAPEEIATLNSLVKRYDQVLLDIDALNVRLQELLGIESPPGSLASSSKCG